MALPIERRSGSIKIDRDSLTLEYWQDFLSHSEATELLKSLAIETPWEEVHLTLFGKRLKMPRLTCWYGDSTAVYSYSGVRNEPNPWTVRLRALKENVERTVSVRFNSVLINLYRDGNDSMSWHSDDEAELGPQPMIASVSLGALRRFDFRQAKQPSMSPRKKYSLELAHGSLLLMSGDTQAAWQHGIAKNPGLGDSRINLTFRRILLGTDPQNRVR